MGGVVIYRDCKLGGLERPAGLPLFAKFRCAPQDGVVESVAVMAEHLREVGADGIVKGVLWRHRSLAHSGVIWCPTIMRMAHTMEGATLVSDDWKRRKPREMSGGRYWI